LGVEGAFPPARVSPSVSSRPGPDHFPRYGARFELRREGPGIWRVDVRAAGGTHWEARLVRGADGFTASPPPPAEAPWRGELEKLQRILKDEGPGRLVRWRE
jgi:hypothetical protein